VLLEFYEESPVPVLRNKLERFWFWFAKIWNQESGLGHLKKYKIPILVLKIRPGSRQPGSKPAANCQF
jgi:hypothetical protein